MSSDAPTRTRGTRSATSIRKRKLTEDRRRQNREAQRRYRERRKPEGNQLPPAEPTYLDPTSLLAGADLDGFTELYTNAPLTTSGDFGLCSDNTSISPFFFDPSMLLVEPPETTQETTRMPSETTQLITRARPGHLPSLPSPYKNHLHIQMLGFYAARIQNALHMGVPLFLAQKDDTISPWYWHTRYAALASPSTTSTASPSPPCTNNEAYIFDEPLPIRRTPCFHLSTTLSPDLSPTPLQRAQPHGMYLDMIPFPVFRDRAITLLSMTPPAFDEKELKRDIEAEGLLVWGTGHGSLTRAGSLVRDRRNWECAGWFWKKWRLLVEGSGLEDQTRWWRDMRGEEEDGNEW